MKESEILQIPVISAEVAAGRLCEIDVVGSPLQHCCCGHVPVQLNSDWSADLLDETILTSGLQHEAVAY